MRGGAAGPRFVDTAMSVGQKLLTRCERLIDRLIAESTAAQRAARGLEGKSMAAEIFGLELTIHATVADTALRLSTDAGKPADVRLRATPLELARLARADADELKTSRVALDGDVHVAEAFAELARLARPDIEDELSRWVGDIAAHELAEAGRALNAFAARAGRALELDTAEYVQEEQRLLPGPLEVDAFGADVDRLRDDVERAEARLERIAAVIEGRR